MTKIKIENRIARINATMAMEGMPLNDDVKKILKEVFKGNLTFEEARKIIDKSYSME